MTRVLAAGRRGSGVQAGALPPRRKWTAITLATLLFVPAYWALLAGAVSAAADRPESPRPAGGPLLAFGLALVPFVFIVLAFVSEHRRAPGAVVRAMALAALVGIPVAAVAADAVTGLVAGLGAGGVAALRADVDHDWKTRAAGVLVVTLYAFALVRIAPEPTLLIAPALPLTAIGVADHLAERRADRRHSEGRQ